MIANGGEDYILG